METKRLFRRVWVVKESTLQWLVRIRCSIGVLANILAPIYCFVKQSTLAMAQFQWSLARETQNSVVDEARGKRDFFQLPPPRKITSHPNPKNIHNNTICLNWIEFEILVPSYITVQSKEPVKCVNIVPMRLMNTAYLIFHAHYFLYIWEEYLDVGICTDQFWTI